MMPISGTPSGEEGQRAIDRIDDPDRAILGRRGASFLADDAVVRIGHRDHRAQTVLDGAIDIGHRAAIGLRFGREATLMRLADDRAAHIGQPAGEFGKFINEGLLHVPGLSTTGPG